MSDEREMTKHGDADFQAHLHKTETVEPEPEAGTEPEGADESEDFEAHMHKPGAGGISDVLKA